MNSSLKKDTLVKSIHKAISQYMAIDQPEFIPGKSLVRYAGAVYGSEELNSMVDVMLKGWFGLGEAGEQLEKELAEYMGAKHAYLTNSGSSADLLAVASLMSYQFTEHLNPGDEVITPACTFPAVVAALVHNGLKPVFVDVDLHTLNPKAEDIEKAIGKKTKMIFLVHTLGNPNDMDPIMEIANRNNLLVLEDNCDALGSTYNGKKTGSFGILSAESFYPAHHMTTAGEGGAVFINNLRLKRIVQSIREWGRSCWCGASGGGTNGVCGVRFNYNIDGIPYDHKYIFSHIGYNIKPVEIQAAMGLVQIKRLPEFVIARKKNFAHYKKFFKKYEKYFILPEAMPKSDPSWFAFPMTIRPDAPFDRFAITQFLEEHMIQTRPIFAGNILRQPGYKNIAHRQIGDLANSNLSFTNTFFIGVYPGLTDKHIEYVTSIFDKYIQKHG
ncbi:MAG TPA: lipopolysaccharide biosynthesis protein RfbH [Candidatus Saccharimonadales bacterium]|nr:lipopolysaccharide biosynthesis protein RfbH [Candidatus Saccharimonadales bacterium]